MSNNLVSNLQHPDPAVRREAVIQLTNIGGQRAIDYLRRVSAIDPDPALRELALQGIGKIEKAQWKQVSQEVRGQQEEEIAQHQAHAESQKRIDIARRSFDLAYQYNVAGKTQTAKQELAKALGMDPTLAENPMVQVLAGQLVDAAGTGLDPVTLLVQQEKLRIEAEAEAANKLKPVVDPVQAKMYAVTAGTALALWISMALFISLMAGDLGEIVSRESLYYRGLQFLRALGPDRWFRLLLPSLLLLLAMIGGNVIMYLLTTLMGGTAGIFRFTATLMGAQAMTFILAIFALSFLPVVDVIPGTTTPRISFVVVFFGAVWNLLWQGYFIGRLQKITLTRSALIVIIGIVIFVTLSGWLGVLKAVRFG